MRNSIWLIIALLVAVLIWRYMEVQKEKEALESQKQELEGVVEKQKEQINLLSTLGNMVPTNILSLGKLRRSAKVQIGTKTYNRSRLESIYRQYIQDEYLVARGELYHAWQLDEGHELTYDQFIYFLRNGYDFVELHQHSDRLKRAEAN